MHGRVDVLLRAGLDRASLHADLLEQALRVDAQHDDYHAAGHACRVGDDLIGGDGDVVPDRGDDIHDGRHNGNLVLRFEIADLVMDDVGCRDAPDGTDGPN